MPLILFVCTANRYRSPIAEACFKRQLEKHFSNGEWDVRSAGTWTTDGLPPTPEAIEAAQQMGLDIQTHRSREVSKVLIDRSGLTLVMEHGHKEALQQEFPGQREKIFLLSEVIRGEPSDIPDPMADPSIGDVSEEICKLIEDGFERILALANNK